MKQSPGAVLLMLVLAGLFWIGMMDKLVDARMYRSTAIHFSLFFAILFVVVLWLMLIGLLILAAVDRSFTRWTGLAALVIVIVSAIGALSAIEFYVESNTPWWWAVVALLPILVGFYAFCPHLMIAAFVILLSAPSIYLYVAETMPKQRAQQIAAKAREREAQQSEERRIAEAFAKLGPDSSMIDYLKYFHDPIRSRAAREGIRQVKSRQTDAVVALKWGYIPDLDELHEYGLAATPEICTAYGAVLSTWATEVAKLPLDTTVLRLEERLPKQLPNLRWLTEAGCDFNGPLTEFENDLRAVGRAARVNEASKSNLNKLADTLASLHQPK